MVVPFIIACGRCFFCEHELFSLLRQLQPERAHGRARCAATRPAGIFGYSPCLRRLRRRPGRVCPGALRRRRPVQGAGRHRRRAGAVPLRHLPDRLHGAPKTATSSPATSWPSGAAGRSASSRSRARICSAPSASSPSTISRAAGDGARAGRAETLNTSEVDVLEALREMTGGRGPDACIDAVGMEAHGTGLDVRLRPRQAGAAAPDRPADGAAPGDHGVPQGRHACRSRASTAASSTRSPWAP